MKKITLLFIGLFIFSGLSYSQETLDELKTMKAEKEGVRDGIQEEINDLDTKIKEFPGWTKGFAGTVGLDFGGTNNWYADDVENIRKSGFGLSLNGFANRNEDKYFWHNGLNAALTSSKVTNEDIDENNGSLQPKEELNSRASLFTLASLAGYQLFSKVYASAEARYETTLLNFNDPGKLTASLGFTWKPINDLVVIIHPLGWQKTFPGGDFSSSPGAKIGATYTGELYPGVTWTSDLNAFMAYGSDEEKGFDRSALSNWTWLNGFAVADVFKGVGVGLNIGLRKDEQLGLGKKVSDPAGIQSFYTLGLTYALAQ